MTRVKICGLTRREDAELALELGAHALGFIFEPSSPRCVTDPTSLFEWLPALGPYVSRVAVFGPLLRWPELLGFQAVQAIFSGAEGVPEHLLKIATVRVGESATLKDVWAESAGADALLLDAHSSSAYGGTGHQVDWSFAAQVVQESERKVILAGGLTPENVAGAIQAVRPWAVDVSSGVEASPGIKDAAKVRDFIQAVRSA